jgi:pimeloyl-ACP methyl ester carboxylesterase
VPGDYRHVKVDAAGHFLAEEAPEQVNSTLISWLDSLA